MIIDDDFISVFAYVAGRVIIHPMTDGTFYFIAIVKFDPDIFFHCDYLRLVFDLLYIFFGCCVKKIMQLI